MAYISQADILHKSRIHIHAVNNLFKQLDDYAIEASVLETALATFCESRSDSERDNNIIRALGCAAFIVSVGSRGHILQSVG